MTGLKDAIPIDVARVLQNFIMNLLKFYKAVHFAPKTMTARMINT